MTTTLTLTDEEAGTLAGILALEELTDPGAPDYRTIAEKLDAAPRTVTTAASRHTAEPAIRTATGEPFVTAPAMRPAVLITAAAYVDREYGTTGYRMAPAAASWTARSGIFEVRASDGSTFYVHADEYGNVRSTETLAELELPQRPDSEC